MITHLEVEYLIAALESKFSREVSLLVEDGRYDGRAVEASLRRVESEVKRVVRSWVEAGR